MSDQPQEFTDYLKIATKSNDSEAVKLLLSDSRANPLEVPLEDIFESSNEVLFEYLQDGRINPSADNNTLFIRFLLYRRKFDGQIIRMILEDPRVNLHEIFDITMAKHRRTGSSRVLKVVLSYQNSIYRNISSYEIQLLYARDPGTIPLLQKSNNVNLFQDDGLIKKVLKEKDYKTATLLLRDRNIKPGIKIPEEIAREWKQWISKDSQKTSEVYGDLYNQEMDSLPTLIMGGIVREVSFLQNRIDLNLLEENFIFY